MRQLKFFKILFFILEKYSVKVWATEKLIDTVYSVNIIMTVYIYFLLSSGSGKLSENQGMWMKLLQYN